jgi:hypothetical protein
MCGRYWELEALCRVSYEPPEYSVRGLDWGLICHPCIHQLPDTLNDDDEVLYRFCRPA